jgi:hypothetical protein
LASQFLQHLLGRPSAISNLGGSQPMASPSLSMESRLLFPRMIVFIITMTTGLVNVFKKDECKIKVS